MSVSQLLLWKVYNVRESISLLIAQFACTVIIVPGLLHDVYNIPSSTSESVSILVNVDEQTNCDGVEGLTITATLTEGTTVSRQQSDFADGIITFTSTSAGDYTCSVTVEDETGPVESVQIQCTPSGKYSYAQIPVLYQSMHAIVTEVCNIISYSQPLLVNRSTIY